ncbi:hypothetical protein [Mucilaginibacter ginsenosidivorans]|uniref:Uncharacterized protein n=1 Tax=Mucilaginibacter ginsenosidivorans TaxID=398053 RepID=A0A5B8V154_9SPHI|nr:hypothetical protein [Mucilaginibacter ginsenosidivorans]QEC64276.1 hypothetical protein FRZ54_17400 [Mucilaginibacter ginsenosidivorans]
MKRLTLVCLICLWHASLFAQSKTNPDSLAYQLQRNKINAMLDQRHQKFGQYSESLKKHTGIFGLQTKKDIRRSNDILMDITKTDEAIFEQIKILLNYRTYQQQQAQVQTSRVQDNSLGYMNTINRLRDQVDKLKQDEQAAKKEQESTTRLHFIVFVLMLGSILFLLFRKRRVTA